MASLTSVEPSVSKTSLKDYVVNFSLSSLEAGEKKKGAGFFSPSLSFLASPPPFFYSFLFWFLIVSSPPVVSFSDEAKETVNRRQPQPHTDQQSVVFKDQ